MPVDLADTWQEAAQNAAKKLGEGSPSVPAGEKLWVDKYGPKSFTELLSDEHTNREV